jgi:hypothetical protein
MIKKLLCKVFGCGPARIDREHAPFLFCVSCGAPVRWDGDPGWVRIDVED